MKNLKIILLVSFISHFNFSFAQYDSLLKSGKKWYYKRFDGERYNPHPIIEIKKDKQRFNSKLYYSFTYNGQDANILMREEGKKVYSVLLGNCKLCNQERIMYDFDLKQNDTFTFIALAKRWTGEFEDSTSNQRMVVDTTYFLNNRKHIRLINDSNIWLRPEWVEGIGGINCFLFYSYSRLDWDPFETNSYLVQACDSVSKIFPYDNLPCNNSILSVNELDRKLKLFPNPTRNNFTITLPTTEKYSIIIYDNLGKKVSEYNLEGNLNYPIFINYPKGFYWVNATKKGSLNYKSVIIIE